MIDGEKLGFRAEPEARETHTDEAQVTALVEWFKANPRAIEPADGESEAQRAIRGLEAAFGTLKIIHEVLSHVLQVPSGISMENLLGAVAGENGALRACLLEAVAHMGKSGHPSAVHAMVAGWRDALYRPWTELPHAPGMAAIMVHLRVTQDAKNVLGQALADGS